MQRDMFQKFVIMCSVSMSAHSMCQDFVLNRSDETDRSSPIITGTSDDLHDIELAVLQPLTVDDLMPFVPKSRNITKNERRAHIEQVLQRAQTRGGKSNDYLIDLQTIVTQQRRKRNIGLPIAIDASQISPALEWLGKKVLKQDVELLNQKFDKQKVITGFSAVGAFIISSGVACLMAYLGSLY